MRRRTGKAVVLDNGVGSCSAWPRTGATFRFRLATAEGQAHALRSRSVSCRCDWHAVQNVHTARSARMRPGHCHLRLARRGGQQRVGGMSNGLIAELWFCSCRLAPRRPCESKRPHPSCKLVQAPFRRTCSRGLLHLRLLDSSCRSRAVHRRAVLSSVWIVSM